MDDPQPPPPPQQQQPPPPKPNVPPRAPGATGSRSTRTGRKKINIEFIENKYEALGWEGDRSLARTRH